MQSYTPTALAVKSPSSKQIAAREGLHLLLGAVERLQAAGPAYTRACLAAGQLHLLVARQIDQLDAEQAAA